jgi:hypothetical protein
MWLGMLLLIVANGLLSAADPFVGTWKLDLRKSTFEQGSPITSETIAITESGDGQAQFVMTQVYSDGSSISVKAVLPIAGGRVRTREGPYDEMVNQPINETTREISFLRSGREVVAYRTVVSKDGNSMKATAIRGTDPQGRPVHDIAVFDKVK